MAPEVLWYIIPREGAYPWEPAGRRSTDLGYLARLAGAVEHLGYSGALLATDLYDVWPLGSALSAATSTRFKPLLAVHPGLISPTLLAKMALSFDQLFGGRLRFNVVNGSTKSLQEYGLHVEHDERYELSAEYWSIVKRLTSGEVFDHRGRFYDLKNAGASFRELKPVQEPHIPLWFGGSSAPGIEMAAQHVDVFLTWGEPPAPAEGEAGTGPGPGRRPRPHPAHRAAAPPHRPGHRGRGVGSGRPAAGRHQRGDVRPAAR